MIKPLSVASTLLAVHLAACSGASSSPTPTALQSEPIAVVCPARAGAVIDVGSEPPWRQYADYRIWTTADGSCIVRIDVLGDRPGPAHCGWEIARVIITGMPVGARYGNQGNTANYVRDPHNVFGDLRTASAFNPDAQLPRGAIDTGFRQRRGELWVDPADGSAIFLVTGTSIERWPLDPDPALCE